MRFILLLLSINIGISVQDTPRAKVNSPKYAAALTLLLKRNVPEMDVQNLFANKEKYILLDTREEEEFNVSHIEGAINVGYKKFDTTKISSIEKSAPIVCYCSAGYRSEKITGQLIKLGYSNVSNLYGSIFEWTNRNFPIVDTNNVRTNQIHAFSKSWGRFIRNKKMVKVY
ncbi:MAG: rhodanese-like domain-containing protein [Saprospiraceae bacterium]